MKTIICTNRRATYEYEVIDTIQAGIILVGTEIKSIRKYKVSLDGSWADIRDGKVVLVGCNIEKYATGGFYNHEPKRDRQLLLNKSEIKKFAEYAKIRGYTLIPLSMYINDGLAKIQLAICKGKQIHDKRQTIKDRDEKNERDNH